MTSAALIGAATTKPVGVMDPARSLPPDVATAVAQLRSPDATVREKATDSLRDYLSPPRDIPAGFSDVPATRPASKPAPIDAAVVDEIAGALRPLLADPEEKVREKTAIALISAPTSTPNVQAGIVEGLKRKEAKLDWYLIQGLEHHAPDVRVVAPLLVERLKTRPDNAYAYGWGLQAYGTSARFVTTSLLPLLAHEDEELARTAANVLMETGLEPADAAAFAKGKVKFAPSLEGEIFVVLLSRPESVAQYVQSHPDLGKHLGRWENRIYGYLCTDDQGKDVVRAELAKVKGLPPVLMATLGDKRFLAELDARMATASAYQRKLLDACARACGREADKLVKISSGKDGDFRPPSAWPKTDESRLGNGPGLSHGDGYTIVVVTGRIRMANGSPAKRVAFYATNDRMLLGEARRDPEPFRYDEKTGTFLFVTSVFAAYADGVREPYQTGSAQTLIEAEGAQPLKVRFFDEMPHVEITLDAARGRDGGAKP